jgi:hypothetical protein
MKEALMPHPTLQPLVELLHQLRQMIVRLDDDDYIMSPPGRTTGGIGGHVRHCLDHVAALLTGTCTGLCTYDRRRRGTEVETSRAAAIEATTEAMIRLLGLDATTLESEVFVETQLDPSGTMVVARSSVGREVAFVVSHTIHHNAIIAQMMQTRGLAFAPRFGVAPATPLDSTRADHIDSGMALCAR